MPPHPQAQRRLTSTAEHSPACPADAHGEQIHQIQIEQSRYSRYSSRAENRYSRAKIQMPQSTGPPAQQRPAQEGSARHDRRSARGRPAVQGLPGHRLPPGQDEGVHHPLGFVPGGGGLWLQAGLLRTTTHSPVRCILLGLFTSVWWSKCACMLMLQRNDSATITQAA